MTPLQTDFFWYFLGFYLAHELIHFGLNVLNTRFTKNQNHIPDFFSEHVDQNTFTKTKSYTIDKLRFDNFSRLMQIPFFWFLIFLGGFNAFDLYAANFAGAGSLGHSVLFCLFIAAYFMIISLPFKYHAIFAIETRYGFNKMGAGLFFTDLLKSILIGLVISTPLLYLIFWFMKGAGPLWWLWVWGTITVFQFFIVALFPTFIAPLFNKFTLLEDGELKEKIQALAQKIGFKLSGIYTMDGSKRSGKSNAYFTGFGKFRRIVLFDTLIKQLSQDELIAVLAHEMGHNIKKHITKSMVLSSCFMLVGFYIMSLLLEWHPFYAAFNIAAPSDHAAFVIFAIASGTFTFMLTPVMNLWSRKNEFEADRFSVETTGNKTAMKSSLLKLTKENLGNLNPHPLFSFYHHSHPTTLERAQAIDQILL